MINDILQEARTKMKATVTVFNDDLHGLRSGRASTALVEKLEVEYYGVPTDLRAVASISTPEPRQILIRPFEKSLLKAIERAIQESDININPQVDGDSIRLNMPPLTRERRLELVKFLHKKAEEARVSIRNIRRNANDDIKDFEREKEISEDDAKRGQDEVQKLTDRHIAEIDELAAAKEKEILDV